MRFQELLISGCYKNNTGGLLKLCKYVLLEIARVNQGKIPDMY